MPISVLSGVERYFPELEFAPQPYEQKQSMINQMATWAKAQFVAGKKGDEFTTPGFDQESSILAMIKAGATNWRALKIIYSFRPGHDQYANFWVNMRNAQAVRNRLKMSEVLLETCLRNRAEATKRGTAANPLRLLSIAAGSAPGVLNVVARLARAGIVVKTVLVDNDRSVAELLAGETRRRDIDEHVRFIPQHAFKFLRAADESVDVIEMLGLLDYLDQRQAIMLGKLIKKQLAPDGFYLTCHIHENPEMDFLRYVINWGVDPFMHYRSPAELEAIVRASGFDKTHVFTEPHGCHSICVGQT